MAFADQPGRNKQYRRLLRRNRVVGGLRLALPAIGLAVLVLLMAQIALSSFGARYGISSIEVTPDRIRVEAPEYAGTMSDGSIYRVWAEDAVAAVANTDLITLSNARVEVARPDGLSREATARSAVLDSATQRVIIAEGADIADSSGTTGRLVDSVFDWMTQTLTSKGPVVIDYADGTTVRSEGLVFEAELNRWTFTRAVVTMPSTPGEDQE